MSVLKVYGMTKNGEVGPLLIKYLLRYGIKCINADVLGKPNQRSSNLNRPRYSILEATHVKHKTIAGNVDDKGISELWVVKFNGLIIIGYNLWLYRGSDS